MDLVESLLEPGGKTVVHLYHRLVSLLLVVELGCRRVNVVLGFTWVGVAMSVLVVLSCLLSGEALEGMYLFEVPFFNDFILNAFEVALDPLGRNLIDNVQVLVLIIPIRLIVLGN